MKKFFCLLLVMCFAFAFTAFSFAEESTMRISEPVYTPDTLFAVNEKASVDVKCKAYMLMDVNTGTVLLANNENVKLYPASVTKIMTLLLVVEAIDCGKLSLSEIITCSDTAAKKGGSQIWLEPGEQMSVDDLLKASFVYSANDACTLLGEKIAGSETAFVDLMNKRAKELGMNDTNFDNCSGLDDDTTVHLTTAYDVSLMAKELMKHDIVKNYSTVWMDTLRNGATQLVNTNKLIRFYEGATGLKTGTTSKAGCCICATAKRGELELIAVVMGAENSNDRFSGAGNLLDYGFANYEVFTPVIDDSAIPDIAVLHGTVKTVKPVSGEVKSVLLNKGKATNVTQQIVVEEKIEAPVEKGMKLGVVNFCVGENVIAQTELVSPCNIDELSISRAFECIFKSVSIRK